jgi:hypothetical protein
MLLASTMIEPEASSNPMPSENYETQKFLWYEPKLTEVESEARELLEKYSHIPSDKVVQHVNSLVCGPLRQFQSRVVHVLTASAIYSEIEHLR